MHKTLRYPRAASLPDLPLTWNDRDGTVLPLSAVALVCKIGKVGATATKTIVSVTGADTAPNITVAFGPSDLDIAVGNWVLQVEGTFAGRKRIATWPLIIEPTVN